MAVSRRLRASLVGLLLAAVGCAAAGGPGGLADGERAYHDGRYTDAELIWLEALEESEAYGERDPRLAQSLRMLANLYVQQERFEEAGPLLERWKQIRERSPDADDSRPRRRHRGAGGHPHGAGRL